MALSDYLVKHFNICWKSHADAPVPKFNEEKINIFNFNHNSEEPLRNKECEAHIQDDYVAIHWLCQEEWNTDLSGMEEEFTRWAKYWIDQYKRRVNSDAELNSVQIKVKVEDRDGFKNDSFIIKI